MHQQSSSLGFLCKLTIVTEYLLTNGGRTWAVGEIDVGPRPNCTTVVIATSAVEYLANGSLRINVGYAAGSAVERYSISADGRTLQFCYPTSPQLLNCPLARLDIGEVVILQDSGQLWQDDYFCADLGDYFIDGHGMAFYCDPIIRPVSVKPRCQWIRIGPQDWDLTPQDRYGNLQLDIESHKGILVNRRQMLRKLNRTLTEVCYPLSIPLLNCQEPHFIAVPPIFYKVLADRRIEYLGDVFELGDYYFVDDMNDVGLCHKGASFALSQAVNILIHVLFAVSTVFQVLAVYYQYKVPKRSTHSKCILCHILSFLVFTLFLLTGDYKLKIQNRITDPVLCSLSFAVAYVMVMAAFFWLNSAAFDAWFCFAHLVQTSATQNPHRRSRFLYYSIYSWGMPIVLCTLLFVFNFSENLQDLLSIKPQIEVFCWFHDTRSAIFFYYGPMLMIITANILFFAATLYHIGRASKDTELVNYQSKKQLLIICVKLFVTMGVSWILEAALAWSLIRHHPYPFWFVSLAIYGLHGIAIFIVISWKGNSILFFKTEAKMAYYHLSHFFCTTKTEETAL